MPLSSPRRIFHGHVPIAHERIQDTDRALGVERIDEVGRAPAVVYQHMWGSCGKFMCNACDGLGRDTRHRGGPFGCVTADFLLKLVETNRIFLDKSNCRTGSHE